MNLIDKAVVGLLPYVPRQIVRRFSARYIAGDNVGAAVQIIRAFNARGMMATIDVLGEFITRLDEADATEAEYEQVLDVIAAERIDSNISIKPTALGLLLDQDHCFHLIDRLATSAAAHKNFVRIDMEDSKCTTDTLNLYRRLREKHDNIGIVLQSYLHRSLQDIEDLLPLKPNVRVCKGIYIEPREIAWHDPEQIRDSFRRMVERLLGAGCYAGIATHDAALVRHGLETVEKLGLPPTAYEFQMLLGVTEELRQSIVDRGHRLRVYTPYGARWYAYSVRRLKENPKIAGYVLQNLIGKVTGNGQGRH